MGYCLGAIECQSSVRLCPVSLSKSDLIFSSLAQSWDEAIPLGNATIGALIWKKDSTLHFSLDRTDLWDLRPTDSLSGDNYRFSWVKEQIQKKIIYRFKKSSTGLMTICRLLLKYRELHWSFHYPN